MSYTKEASETATVGSGVSSIELMAAAWRRTTTHVKRQVRHFHYWVACSSSRATRLLAVRLK